MNDATLASEDANSVRLLEVVKSVDNWRKLSKLLTTACFSCQSCQQGVTAVTAVIVVKTVKAIDSK